MASLSFLLWAGLMLLLNSHYLCGLQAVIKLFGEKSIQYYFLKVPGEGV